MTLGLHRQALLSNLFKTILYGHNSRTTFSCLNKMLTYHLIFIKLYVICLVLCNQILNFIPLSFFTSVLFLSIYKFHYFTIFYFTKMQHVIIYSLLKFLFWCNVIALHFMFPQFSFSLWYIVSCMKIKKNTLIINSFFLIAFSPLSNGFIYYIMFF